MQSIVGLFSKPRIAGAICAVAATSLGLIYMSLAGAPISYLVMNTSALVIGFVLLLAIAFTFRKLERHADIAVFAIGIVLVATALFGSAVEGASRWVLVGNLFIQTSLIGLPVAAVLFTRSRGTIGLGGIALVICAMALQPDRAMAAALFVALAALACMGLERRAIVAATLASLGFSITMIQPDNLPAMPYVDQIFYTSFEAHPIAGLAVLSGVIVLIMPALVGWLTDPQNRTAYAVFGTIWLAIAGAAALGNYPTPVVGYGGSAIIGYVLCLAALPKRRAAVTESKNGTERLHQGANERGKMRKIAQAA